MHDKTFESHNERKHYGIYYTAWCCANKCPRMISDDNTKFIPSKPIFLAENSTFSKVWHYSTTVSLENRTGFLRIS